MNEFICTPYKIKHAKGRLTINTQNMIKLNSFKMAIVKQKKKKQIWKLFIIYLCTSVWLCNN